jgi:prepilin-type N-terminal cleavage/methylation domain-containing protein
MKIKIATVQFGRGPAPQLTSVGVRAFTLLEVLMAAAIGAVIFTALYTGISNCFSMLYTSRANLRATQIMVSRLEALRLCAWGNGTNQSSQLFNTNIIPPTFKEYFYPLGMNGDTNSRGTVYNGTMTVTPNPPLGTSYSSSMALVTVTVTWTDGFVGHTNTYTRSMSTYVAQYGVQNYVYNH